LPHHRSGDDDLVHSPSHVVAVVGPDPGGELQRAVAAGGAALHSSGGATAGLVWTGADVQALDDSIVGLPALQWVQLPSAGVEQYERLMSQHPQVMWTCAKGIYGASVAEQAVAMLLALRRGLPAHAAARTWSPTVPSRPLVGSGEVVTLLGGGGIALHVARLLAPFGVRLRVVRRQPDQGFAGPHDGIFSEHELDEALAGTEALVLTLPLTAHTRGMIGERELRLLNRGAVLVNVGRGGVLDHAPLLPLLEESFLDGVALDVTEPEPLPPDSGLWSHPRCLITSHTSNPDVWRREQFAQLVRDNVARFVAGEDLQGRVDLASGY
jgi:phosphoglycerate dehydrogenase-like enzyme